MQAQASPLPNPLLDPSLSCVLGTELGYLLSHPLAVGGQHIGDPSLAKGKIPCVE